MGYVIQAIVADEGILRPSVRHLGPVVALPQGKALLPLGASVIRALGAQPFTLTDDADPHAEVPAPITELLRSLSRRGKVAYIEAEIFGGAGLQACVVAQEGVVEPKVVGMEAINGALRFVGVVAGAAVDEFEAVALGRHRHTEEWR